MSEDTFEQNVGAPTPKETLISLVISLDDQIARAEKELSIPLLEEKEDVTTQDKVNFLIGRIAKLTERMRVVNAVLENL